jgi:hypothetical protein
MLVTPGLFLLSLVPMAKASLVTGTFAPGGTSVEVTATEMYFYNLGVAPPVTPTGEFTVDAPVTASFSGLGGADAYITDLTDTPSDAACTGCIYAPTDAAVGTPNVFIDIPSLTPGDTIDIELTGLSAGADTPGTPICSSLTLGELVAAGTSCTPASNSPFILANEFDSSTGEINTVVSFSAAGLAWFTATPSQTSDAAMNFTTSFTGDTIAGVLGTISSTGNIVSSLAGSIVVTAASTVPEPGAGAMMLLAGGALLLLSRIRVRRKG